MTGRICRSRTILRRQENISGKYRGAILDDVAETINVELPVEKYDTFSGFVCGVLERVPEDGEQFRCGWKNLDIVVNQVRNHTVVEDRSCSA